MIEATHLSTDELEAGLDQLRASPTEEGVLELIVRRPGVGEREILEEAELDTVDGLLGDTWNVRGSSRTPDGASHPDMQLTIMNSRAAALVARTRDRWPLAGDQLFIEMDLSRENLPAGSRLALGSAIFEVTDLPHTGCKNFAERFGTAAMRFVNSPTGRQLNLRGINAKVVRGGVIRVGDLAKRIPLKP